MTYDQLKVFVAIVQHGSFRAAAEAIFKTQSTLSSAIKNLEQEFSIQLFNRDSYRPTLTEEGKAFYQKASALLRETQDLEALGHTLAHTHTPELSLSLSAMCAVPPDLNAIKTFCDQYPTLRLTIETEHLSGLLELLHTGKAELAIGPYHGLDNRYEYEQISQIEMITVAAPGYFPEESGPLSHAQVRERPHILISDTGSSPVDHINVIPGGRRWYVNDYQMKKALMLSHMGWARIPLHMVQQEIGNQQLVPIQIERFNSTGYLPIYLIRLRNQTLSELARAFWQHLLHDFTNHQ